MKIPFYQIDAFASQVFSGNPAGVCLLDDWLSDEILQSIATENNLPETAFIVRRETYYDLRWFTPAVEIDLCGHATLASGYVIFEYLGHDSESVEFMSKSGKLSVDKKICYFSTFHLESQRNVILQMASTISLAYHHRKSSHPVIC
jgi:PhzF family phenazine biosynthesis protein